MKTPVQRIRRLFEERFRRYEDRSPHGVYSRDVEPLECSYFIVSLHKQNPLVPIERRRRVLHEDYVNGAILSYAIQLVSARVEFTEESVARAERIKDLFIASPVFVDVKLYLLEGTPTREEIEEKSKSYHERYVREMAIEFNQVKSADGYVCYLRRGVTTLAEIVEDMKANYYSSWKNEKDPEWIASLSNYTDDYIVKEYARLNHRSISL